MYLLTLTDTYCAVYTVLLVCLAECISVGWVYGSAAFLTSSVSASAVEARTGSWGTSR